MAGAAFFQLDTKHFIKKSQLQDTGMVIPLDATESWIDAAWRERCGPKPTAPTPPPLRLATLDGAPIRTRAMRLDGGAPAERLDDESERLLDLAAAGAFGRLDDGEVDDGDEDFESPTVDADDSDDMAELWRAKDAYDRRAGE